MENSKKTPQKNVLISRLIIKNLRFIVGRYNAVVEEVVAGIAQRRGMIVVACSMNDVANASLYPDIGRCYHDVDICTSDGMPLVWWASLCVHRGVDRVYGPDLMKSVITGTQSSRLKHVFCGSSPPRLTNLVNVLTSIAPKVHIAGVFAPKLESEETTDEQSVLEQIIACKPSVLWLGISTPKQVMLAARWKKRLPRTAIVCVGAAFDQVSGATQRAPGWMQMCGLEWLFRLIIEPRRLYRRYLFVIPRFILKEIVVRLQSAV